MELDDLTLHDRIWFESIREFRVVMARRGKPERDVVLDQLIRMGLIDKEESVMSSGPSQLFRYVSGKLVSKTFCRP